MIYSRLRGHQTRKNSVMQEKGMLSIVTIKIPVGVVSYKSAKLLDEPRFLSVHAF